MAPTICLTSKNNTCSHGHVHSNVHGSLVRLHVHLLLHSFLQPHFLEQGKHQRLGYSQSSPIFSFLLSPMSHFLLLSSPIRLDVVILHVEQAPDPICIQPGMQHEAHVETRQRGLAVFYHKVILSECIDCV